MSALLLEFVGRSAALAFNLGSTISSNIANKATLQQLPYPAALTAMHYIGSCFITTSLLCLGAFQSVGIPPEHRGKFAALIAAWAMHDTLCSWAVASGLNFSSHESMKVLAVPIVGIVDLKWHGKSRSPFQAIVLAVACCATAVATASDVRLNTLGSVLIALLIVLTGTAQKILIEHMQQRVGISSLHLMHAAFPCLLLSSLLVVPTVDPPGVTTTVWSSALLSSLRNSTVAAVFVDFSTTVVIGSTSALALVLLGQFRTCGTLLAHVFIYDKVLSDEVAISACVAVVSIYLYMIHVTGINVQHWHPATRHRESYEPLTAANDKDSQSPWRWS